MRKSVLYLLYVYPPMPRTVVGLWGAKYGAKHILCPTVNSARIVVTLLVQVFQQSCTNE
jgi:hypothetical protein